MTDAERLQALEDQEALRRLTFLYGMGAYQADGAALAALFTPDGYFESIGDDGVRFEVSGRDALAVRLSAGGPGGVLPMVHNHLYEVAGDIAWGTCVMENPWGPGRPNGFVGIYHDRFVRQGGRWLFTERRFHRLAAPAAS